MQDDQKASALDDIGLIQPHFEHASTAQRFVNYVVDMLICFACCFAMLYFSGIMVLPGHGESFTINTLFPDTELVSWLLLPAYTLFFTLAEGLTKGRTPGKLITGTVAVKKDITEIGWKEAFARSLLRMVPFDVLTGLKGHPWHDKFSNTYVVKKSQIIW